MGVVRKKNLVPNLKHGRQSKAIMGLRGCDPCPWKRTCAMYQQGHRQGCEARTQWLVAARKEVGNVEQALFERAVKLREEIEAEALAIRKSGESPLNNKSWLKAYEIDLELAKFLTKLRHGTKSEQHVYVHKDDDDGYIVINSKAYGEEDGKKQE